MADGSGENFTLWNKMTETVYKDTEYPIDENYPDLISLLLLCVVTRIGRKMERRMKSIIFFNSTT